MSPGQINAVFVMPTSKAYGENATALSLAESIARAGGRVNFLASPLASKIVAGKFGNGVHQLTTDRNVNQAAWQSCIRSLRPNLVVFSELFEVLCPHWMHECPLIDRSWLQTLDQLDAAMVWLDLSGFAPLLRGSADRPLSRLQFGDRPLRTFLKRLSVILPCPVNEPRLVPGRCGIPYRALSLPLEVSHKDRLRTRHQFLGRHAAGSYMVLHAVSSWQTMLVERLGLPLFEHLTDLLSVYFAALNKPVKFISVSDKTSFRPVNRRGFEVLNLKSMAPADYERLLLSADLVLTENEGSYMLAKVLGRVTGLVLINTFELEEILQREGAASPIRDLVLQMERRRAGSIYPHLIYPIRAEPWQFAGARQTDPANRPVAIQQHHVRGNRFVSSPFLRAELYGGNETRALIQTLLSNSSARDAVRAQEMSYIERQRSLDDGLGALVKVLQGGANGHTVMQETFPAW